MNERTIRILEFDKITAALSEHADSAPGRERCLALRPLTDRSEILLQQQYTKDAIDRYLKNSAVSFGACFDGSKMLSALKVGRGLEADQLLKAAHFLSGCARVKSYGETKETEESDSLTQWFEALVPMRELSERILRSILSENEIADDAFENVLGLAVIGKHGSFAETFARTHGYAFVPN